MNTNKKWKLAWIAPAAIAGMALFVSLGGWIVMSLWNWLVPELFGLRAVTFWQALGLLLLCRILFGSFGMSGSSRSRRKMSEEERDRLRRARPEPDAAAGEPAQP